MKGPLSEDWSRGVNGLSSEALSPGGQVSIGAGLRRRYQGRPEYRK